MTEQKRIEELLKPRYLIMKDWPGNSFENGAILMQDLDTVGEVYVEHTRLGEKNTDRDFMLPEYIDKYPHLIRKMHWSEKRGEDLPKYIGWINEDGKFNWVSPVVKWINTDNRREPLSCIISFTNLQGEYEEREMNQFDLFPATESDYLQYIKSKDNG